MDARTLEVGVYRVFLLVYYTQLPSQTNNRGRTSPIYRQDRYMPPDGVWFLKTSILKNIAYRFLPYWHCVPGVILKWVT